MVNGWRHSYMAAMVAAVALASSITPAAAVVDIGRVKTVVFSAYGTPPAEIRKVLYARNKIYSNEVVETSKKSALHLTFLDKTIFRLGAESRATLDTYIYDPDSKAGELTLILKEGIFRIKTGKMKKEGIRIVTPVAVIAVIGTDFIVEVSAAGTIRVAVLEGQVDISPTAPGAPQISLAAPATGEIDSGGGVNHGVGPSPDSGLDDGAGAANRSGGGSY